MSAKLLVVKGNQQEDRCSPFWGVRFLTRRLAHPYFGSGSSPRFWLSRFETRAAKFGTGQPSVRKWPVLFFGRDRRSNWIAALFGWSSKVADSRSSFFLWPSCCCNPPCLEGRYTHTANPFRYIVLFAHGRLSLTLVTTGRLGLAFDGRYLALAGLSCLRTLYIMNLEAAR